MIRRSAMQKRCLALVVLLALAWLLAGSGQQPRADTFSYASQKRQIRACVLVSGAVYKTVGTTRVPENVDPHVFYIMDQRKDLRPSGWEFVNPLAPNSISGEMFLRWRTRNTAGNGSDPAFQMGTPENALFRIGSALTKNIGAYWEVNLDDISTDDLQQFDVVFMGYKSNAQFSPEEREKLRHYMDAGGTIWLEDEGGLNINGGINGGQFPINLRFVGNVPVNGSRSLLTSAHHPIVNFPFGISPVEALGLDAGGGGGRKYHVDPVGGGPANPRIVTTIVQAGNSPMISAGEFGAGHLVISSAGLANSINAYVGGVNMGNGGNSSAISGTSLLAALPTALKIAYNIIAWTSSVPTEGVNPRRTESTQEHIGSQLGRKWMTVPIPAPSGVGSGAVIYKGVVFYVDGNNVLHAYDANPETDLDGDGNVDDGIPDYIYGAPYDEIWNVNLTTIPGTRTMADTRVSTPTVYSVYDATRGKLLDVVSVTTGRGVTMAFDAFPRDVRGRLQPSSTLVWPPVLAETNIDLRLQALAGDFSAGRPVPGPSPTFSEGILFSIVNKTTGDPDNGWKVYPIDPTTGDNVFNDNANGMAPSPINSGGFVPGLPDVNGPLTVGYVRDDATGAQDKMVYVPSHTSTVTGGPPAHGVVHGLWFSTRNEPLDSYAGGTSGRDYRPRGLRARVPWFVNPPAGVNGIDLRPVIHVVRRDPATNQVTSTGTLLQGSDFTVSYDPDPMNPMAHTMNVHLNTTLANPTEVAVYADYTLDWPDAAINGIVPTIPELTQFTNTRLFTLFNPNTSTMASNTVYLSGAPALTPEDNLIVGGADYPGPEYDPIFCVRDQFISGAVAAGSGPVRRGAAISWMFAANAAIKADDPTIILGSARNLDPRLINRDNFGIPGFVVEPPTKSFGDIDVIGSPAVLNGVTYVVAAAHAFATDTSGTRALFSATIILALRSNPSMSFTSNTPIPSDTNMKVSLVQIDPYNTNHTPPIGRPKYRVLEEGLNFTVDRESGTIHIFDCKTRNLDSFNTALPISVEVGPLDLNNVPEPIVQNPGSTVGPLDNLLWWMAIPFSDTINPDITIPDVTANVGSMTPSGGPSVLGDTLFYGTQGGDVVAVDLPLNENAGKQRSLHDENNKPRVHVLPVLTGPNGNPIAQQIIYPPLGTAGQLAVGSERGLTLLENQLTLIADNNRLLEVDSGGNAVWSMDATKSLRVAGGNLRDSGQVATTNVSLARPTVARRIALNDFLIADSTNNRIAQTDRGGLTTWELHTMGNDMKFLRPGDPVTLNHPTDVQTFSDSNSDPAGTYQVKNRDTGVTYTYRGPGPYYAVHYVIADSGNYRAVEVVDLFDGNGNYAVMHPDNGNYADVTMNHQVVFVTRTLSEQNAHFRYRTIQQFTTQDPTDSTKFNTYLIAAVDNVRQSPLDPGTAASGLDSSSEKGPGGSLAVIRRNFVQNGLQVLNPKDGDTAAIINSIAFPTTPTSDIIARRQAISNPTWFKEFNVLDPMNPNVPKPHYMLADDNGCYELEPVGTDAIVRWTIAADDYYFMTGRRLKAASVQRLSEADYAGAPIDKFYPHYLITNRYTGEDNIPEVFGPMSMLPILPAGVPRGDVHGEVIELRGITYVQGVGGVSGYRSTNARLYQMGTAGNVWKINIGAGSPIVWMVPNETLPTNANGLTVPGVVKRSIGDPSGATSTYLLEQPSFSDRPF